MKGTCQVGSVFSACTMQSLYAGFMPTQMVPHTYAKSKGCLITREFSWIRCLCRCLCGVLCWMAMYCTSTWKIDGKSAHLHLEFPRIHDVGHSNKTCSSSLGRGCEISKTPRALLVRAPLYRDFTYPWLLSSFPSTSLAERGAVNFPPKTEVGSDFSPKG